MKKNNILDFFSQHFLSKSLISSEWHERMANGHSFVLSDLSDSLTVAHFLWAIFSRSLICLERSELIANSCSFDLSEMSEWMNEQWANERIPSPAFSRKVSNKFRTSWVYYLWLLPLIFRLITRACSVESFWVNQLLISWDFVKISQPKMAQN